MDMPLKKGIASQKTNRLLIGIRYVLAGFVLLALAGALYQFIADLSTPVRFPAPGEMIPVGIFKMHLYCTGPEQAVGPVILLDGGTPDFSLIWSRVQPEVAAFARVCSFDRAGLGWSAPNPAAPQRTSAQVVDEVHRLLESANLAAPYILVGHSFGGLDMRLYAMQYPEEVAGLVLVDSAFEVEAENQPAAYQKLVNQTIRNLSLARSLSTLGLVRLVKPEVFVHSALPVELRSEYAALSIRTQSLRAAEAERSGMANSFTQLKDADPAPLVNIPLVVLASSKSFNAADLPSSFPVDEANQIHIEAQKTLAALSTRSELVVTDQSDHYIHLRQPELVISAIQKLFLISRTK